MAEYHEVVLKSGVDLLPRDLRVAIVVADFNGQYTHRLMDSNRAFLLDHGFGQVDVFHVPGALELPGMAKQLLTTGSYAAILLLGVIVKGKTMHYEFISQAIFSSIVDLTIDYSSTAIISGVLTVEDESLLEERISDNYARYLLHLLVEKKKVVGS